MKEKVVIVLKRRTIGEEGTFGILTLKHDGEEKTWVTLENTSKRIPVGKYPLVLEYSPKFQRDLWTVKHPKRVGIRVHPANVQRELEGCIALGRAAGILSSRDAVNDFSRCLGKLDPQKYEFVLVVEEDPK